MILAITPPGPFEWIIIGLIFVLLFGAKKLPELGGAIGKSIKSFKAGVEDTKDETAAQEPDASADTSTTRDGQ